MMFVGATTHKNSLGILCAILIIMFVWHLIHTPRPATPWEKRDRRIHILLVLMMVWLMYIANSATSVMCCGIGLAVVYGMELPVMQRNLRHIRIPAIILSDNIDENVLGIMNSLPNSFGFVKPINYGRFRELVGEIMSGMPALREGYSIVYD